jgi:hypothetical protein
MTILAGSLASVPASADQVVYFVNGKAITVKNVEKGDRLTILEIEGGGRIGVPTAQIDRIEELQLSAPAQGVPAPAVQMVPSQGAPVAPAASATQPPTTVPPVQQAGAAPPPSVSTQGPQGPAREVPAPVVTAPQAADAKARPVMPSGANRQFGARKDGALNQPGAGMRRMGARNGSFRGRPMYQPPLAPSDRRKQDRPGNTESQSANPQEPPAQEPPPAVSPPAPSDEEPRQADEAPPADEQDQAEPPAEPDGESAEER